MQVIKLWCAVAAAAVCSASAASAQQLVTDINGFRARPSAAVNDPGTVKTITPTPVGSAITPVPSALIYEETNFTNTGVGFQANRAEFLFSNDGGASGRFFRNTFGMQDAFDISFDLKLETSAATPRKEAGMRIDFNGFDGLFIVNTDAHEIVAFGGTLPFYSFNASNGLSYNAGDTINMRMVYTPPVLDNLNAVLVKGKVEYIVNQGLGPVSSMPLEFSGTESGIIDGSNLGLHVQATGAVNDTTDFVRATWSNFDFDGPGNADFDHNGIVDGTDFLAFQRGLGITTGATRAQGDANSDGAVNSADLAIFRDQFGKTQPLVSSVPEPPAASLLSAAVFAGIFARRRARGRTRDSVHFRSCLV